LNSPAPEFVHSEAAIVRRMFQNTDLRRPGEQLPLAVDLAMKLVPGVPLIVGVLHFDGADDLRRVEVYFQIHAVTPEFPSAPARDRMAVESLGGVPGKWRGGIAPSLLRNR
jgi:hypothetical protein